MNGSRSAPLRPNQYPPSMRGSAPAAWKPASVSASKAAASQIQRYQRPANPHTAARAAIARRHRSVPPHRRFHADDAPRTRCRRAKPPRSANHPPAATALPGNSRTRAVDPSPCAGPDVPAGSSSNCRAMLPVPVRRAARSALPAWPRTGPTTPSRSSAGSRTPSATSAPAPAPPPAFPGSARIG